MRVGIDCQEDMAHYPPLSTLNMLQDRPSILKDRGHCWMQFSVVVAVTGRLLHYPFPFHESGSTNAKGSSISMVVRLGLTAKTLAYAS